MCDKKLTDTDRLAHHEFARLLEHVDSYKISHWRQYPPEISLILPLPECSEEPEKEE